MAEDYSAAEWLADALPPAPTPMLFCGTAGCGKSLAFWQTLAVWRARPEAREEAVIIFDCDGVFSGSANVPAGMNAPKPADFLSEPFHPIPHDVAGYFLPEVGGVFYIDISSHVATEAECREGVARVLDGFARRTGGKPRRVILAADEVMRLGADLTNRMVGLMPPPGGPESFTPLLVTMRPQDLSLPAVNGLDSALLFLEPRRTLDGPASLRWPGVDGLHKLPRGVAYFVTAGGGGRRLVKISRPAGAEEEPRSEESRPAGDFKHSTLGGRYVDVLDPRRVLGLGLKGGGSDE